MAAVPPGSIINPGPFVPGRPYRIRTATAQATVGQTDWIAVPYHAQYCWVYIDVTAMTGTTPNVLPQFRALEPITLNDSNAVQIGGALTGGITSSGQLVAHIGPGVSGIADATLAVSASGGSKVEYNQILPPILGIQVVNFRGSADETYTYTITLVFRED